MSSNVTGVFGRNVFNEAMMRERLPKDVFQVSQADHRRRAAAGSGHGGRDRQRDEGLGHREGRHALLPLVPADDRHDRREARFLHLPDRRRPHDHGVQRQGTDPGRAGCFVVPVRRPARDVRGPRLYRLGLHLPGLRQGERREHHAVHPERVLLLHQRSAGQEDPAAALDGCAEQAGGPRAARLWATRPSSG